MKSFDTILFLVFIKRSESKSARVRFLSAVNQRNISDQCLAVDAKPTVESSTIDFSASTKSQVSNARARGRQVSQGEASMVH